uniref:Protein CDV3 homolog n=1 Tax=Trichuris muris TaxID=70415 RepID=A0A5S6QRU1_TRIMR
MADEIESFFKSKKKVSAKKMGAQTPDILGRHLEQAVQDQENFDVVEDEWKQGGVDRTVELPNEGDSEWIEEDENPEFNLPALKDLESDSGSADNEEDEINEDGLSKQKAWKVGEGNVEPTVEKQIEATTEEKPKAYVSPALKAHLATRVAKEMNLTSADEFPSLADADDLCKAEIDKKITPKATSTVAHGNAWRRMQEPRPSHFNSSTNKIMDEPIYSREVSTQPPKREESPPRNRYVPPHLRK